jgi:hypothetical protein
MLFTEGSYTPAPSAFTAFVPPPVVVVVAPPPAFPDFALWMSSLI